jgi:hypothetical protein
MKRNAGGKHRGPAGHRRSVRVQGLLAFAAVWLL